ncbi:conserved hypothetical protein [Aeromonas phage 65]|uniref:Uncharacterized protein n=2 Tax=Ishigurovirus osborne TaxID=260149 RepID=E5DRX2_9CAUD|nr:hypothetical protein ST65p138 [Aeromonas phage 65]ADQ53146.1 conserved hypothetical protein [Aeromonas phage 65]
MAMMHEKKHAREGRGSANGGNEKWYNSPLWEKVEAKQVSLDATPDDLLKEKENEDLRAKQRRMFAMAY